DKETAEPRKKCLAGFGPIPTKPDRRWLASLVTLRLATRAIVTSCGGNIRVNLVGSSPLGGMGMNERAPRLDPLMGPALSPRELWPPIPGVLESRPKGARGRPRRKGQLHHHLLPR